MNVKRIKAKTSREALALLRQMLGDDAVILSNRTIPGGVEVMAMPVDELREVAEPGYATRSAALSPGAASLGGRQPPNKGKPAQTNPARQPVPLRDFATVLHRTDRAPIGAVAYAQHAHAPGQERLDADSPQPLKAARRHVAPLAAATASNTPRAAQAGRLPAATAAAAAAPGVLRGQAPARPLRATAAVSHRAKGSGERDAFAPPPLAAVAEGQGATAVVARELSALRALVETQLTDLGLEGLAARAPQRMLLMGELLNSGFSPVLARKITEGFPVKLSGRDARDWVQALLVRHLRCAGADLDPISVGGVYAFVGPTGVGKTTTIAKMAARALVRHSAAQVALISADNYRIGAQDQLDWYGHMLGVPVRRVRDQAELTTALAAFADRKLVFIDTAGMSQRDAHVPEQLALLNAAGVKRIVLLNAGAQAETLDDVIRAYLPQSGQADARAIVTKLDEAVKLGGVVDCAIRRQLTLFYVTTGQRVPEDMHPAHGLYLVDKALRHVQSPVFARQAEEQRLQLGASLKAASKGGAGASPSAATLTEMGALHAGALHA